MMPMEPYQSIHFTGVLSPEMASLAMYMARRHGKVSGSDDHGDTLFAPALEKAGVTFFDMFAQTNVSKTTDLLVLSRYYDAKHPEVVEATKHKIPVMLETDFLKLVLGDRRRLAVLGRYEAPLITGLLDHTWHSGHTMVESLTKVVSSDDSQSLARVEADAEWFLTSFPGLKRDANTYEADFLSFDAEIIIIPSIIYDSPELNTTLDEVYQSYYNFVKRVPRKGVIIGNGDWSRMRRLVSHLADRHFETYGLDRDNSWHIREVTVGGNKTSFSLAHDRQLYGPFMIPYVGMQFVYSATAVIVTSLVMEMKPETIGRGLLTAPLFRRYLETSIDREGRILIDDQADHPDMIRSVLQTIRSAYPDKRIWCLYQPGSFLRTKALMNELEEALSLADFIYMTDIKGYPREKSEGIHTRHVVADMKRRHHQTHYFDASTDMSGLLSDRVPSTDCIVTLGTLGVCQEIVAPLLHNEVDLKATS